MPVPTISGVSPNSGSTSGGTAVAISGAFFTGATGVNFGTTPAAGFHVVSDSQITATSPAGAPGTVDITVTNASGTSNFVTQDQFLYVQPTPTVSSVSPSSGPSTGGTVTSIFGTNFTGATNVFFGTSQCTIFSVVSSTQITATAPPNAAGSVDVRVTTPSGTSPANPNDVFTYQPPPGPVVQSLNPTSGLTTGGTTVVITGANFLGATGVFFGTAPATNFTVNSSTQITATAPPNAAGSVDVLVTTPNGTSAANPGDVFLYVSGVPSVTSVSPTSGPSAGNTQVSIMGNNFNGITSVAFGGTPATSFTVLSSTKISATSPAHAQGTVDIIVSNNQGSSSPSPGDQFLFT